ncbi:proton channel OtopLc-like [Mytilus edulis]
MNDRNDLYADNDHKIGVTMPDSDSGEETEMYRAFSDNVDTDVSNNNNTQDESDAPSPPMARGSRFVPNHLPANNLNALTNRYSDSDSCTDGELAGDQTTDETTSTSESEETQIWVPICNRPSYRQNASSPPIPLPFPPSLTSSGASEALQQILNAHRNTLPRCSHRDRGDMSSANPSNVASPEVTENEATLERGRRHSWHTPHVLNNSRRHQAKSASLIQHNTRTGTTEAFLIDETHGHGPNGDSGIGHDDIVHSGDSFDRDFPPSASMSMLRRRGYGSDDQNCDTTLIDTLFIALSGLYAMGVVVFGLVVPIAEIFAPSPMTFLFEGFYIYLYAVSICFLIYAYTYLLQNTTLIVRKKQRRFVPPEVAASSSFKQKKYSYDISRTYHTGSFYLRLGAVGFGIGSMIKSGLHFGELFDHDILACNGVLHALRPILHVSFTFVQLYFVFLNSKMCIQRHKTLARFGLMHMVATNMCVWLETIVVETIREVEKTSQIETSVTVMPLVEGTTSSSVENITSILQPSLCQGPSLMKEVVHSSGPYLYPCSIEYSLICAGILYVMWRNIGKHETNPNLPGSSGDQKSKTQRINVDCSSSSRGLFMGIFVLVASVISMITFFVLVRSTTFVDTAIKIEHLSKVAIHVMTSVAVILAFHRMQSLKFNYDQKLDLEETLILVSLGGVYMFGFFSIVASAFDDHESNGLLVILSCVLGMFQATIQTVFLLHALRKSALRREQERVKPGREFVTFLLMCNIALWAINTFEVQRTEANPIQFHFYGSIAWNIFNHISLPLQIFFRFHSTVCLSNIWKKAWKRRNHK